MKNQKTEVNKFLEYHSIRVLDTHKRACRKNRLNYDLFQHPDNFNVVDTINPSVRFETEPLYTVEISESELERIARFEQTVFNNLEENGHYNLFELLMQQKEEERNLINSFPAVKKAYEHYSLMLNLAKNHQL